MDENERRNKITDSLWWWLPARWSHNGSWYEIRGFDLTGDAGDGGVDVQVSKDEGDPSTVHFTNSECYGELKMTPEGARGRVYSEVE
jgi:hypothetical protein